VKTSTSIQYRYAHKTARGELVSWRVGDLANEFAK
jgi:hypothetical protein